MPLPPISRGCNLAPLVFNRENQSTLHQNHPPSTSHWISSCWRFSSKGNLNVVLIAAPSLLGDQGPDILQFSEAREADSHPRYRGRLLKLPTPPRVSPAPKLGLRSFSLQPPPPSGHENGQFRNFRPRLTGVYRLQLPPHRCVLTVVPFFW